MKLDLLKKLIKEAVKEAVREELEVILSEGVNSAKVPTEMVSEYREAKPTVTKYEKYKPTIGKPVTKGYVPTGDPLTDLLNETRAAMISNPDTGYRPDMSSMVSAPGLGMETAMEDYFARPEIGVDLSQLDFVKNAGAIFKASQEKDKQRLGA
jgi:hypothetical protein